MDQGADLHHSVTIAPYRIRGMSPSRTRDVVQCYVYLHDLLSTLHLVGICNKPLCRSSGPIAQGEGMLSVVKRKFYAIMAYAVKDILTRNPGGLGGL